MYSIEPLKSDRDGIKKTPAQKAFIMPSPGTMCVIGSTGSGKTTIVGTLLKKSTMLKNYFDKIYIFCLSPCTTLIDNVPQIDEDNVFTEDNPDKLAELYETQKRALKTIGFKRCPHILFILDDIVQSRDFMKSQILTDIFFGGTHSKVSLWLLSQNYMSIPRRLRMNCHNLILCHGVNSTEIDRFAEEWQSAYLKRKEFTALVEYCLDKQYSFLFLNATNPNKKKMYRCGFEHILAIP